MYTFLLLHLLSLFLFSLCRAFVPQTKIGNHPLPFVATKQLASSKEEWTGDFDGFVGDDNTSLSDFLAESRLGRNRDLTAVQTRLFSLGEDLIINDFVGNLGFDEVTDWEYYYDESEKEGVNDRRVVESNPFDQSMPKRTRISSGSVVRVFRAELVGRLGATISSRGLDRRILIKEYSGDLALQLASNEQVAISRLQSQLMEKEKIKGAIEGSWIQCASSRTVLTRKDDAHVGDLLKMLSLSPFLGILGQVNLAEIDDMDPNDFYRALGVTPPKPESVWIVFEYTGLNTIASYTSMPPEKRRAKQPPKKNFFGSFIPPKPLPPFRERANFIIKGIMKKSLSALATLHEAGIVHRSLGRNSFVLSSPSQNKAESSSIYFTRISGLVVKLSDLGFAGLLEDSTKDQAFISRARSFGLSFRTGDTSLTTTNFAMAEDLHALGFVFLGLLLVSLANLPDANAPMPATDEDTIQKLLNEIFKLDFQAFREYVEAEDVWENLVLLLDEKDGAGWIVLESLFKAREKVAENKNMPRIVTARGLLSNPFF